MSSKTYPTNNTEQALFEAGYRFILGIDEVGRGALAGPVAVGIAVLESSMHAGRTDWPSQLCDSKLISEKVREQLFEPVGTWVAGYAVGMASAAEIDELGITKCLSLAAERAVRELPAELRAQVAANPGTATAILDGSHNWLGTALGPVSAAVKTKADRDCVSVAAASVLAKVTRDRMMGQLVATDVDLERYGIAGNKGYSSQQHLDALREFGPVEQHRKTWLGKILGENQLF